MVHIVREDQLGTLGPFSASVCFKWSTHSVCRPTGKEKTHLIAFFLFFFSPASPCGRLFSGPLHLVPTNTLGLF